MRGEPPQQFPISLLLIAIRPYYTLITMSKNGHFHKNVKFATSLKHKIIKKCKSQNVKMHKI